MSVKIDTDDVEDMNEYTSEAHKIKGFKDIIVDIYIFEASANDIALFLL
jgi:hypothetical protein